MIRRDEIDDTPGEATLAGNVANFTTSGITAGRTVSKELFGEVEVPLLEGVPMIERLTLSGAARYTHVEATRRDGVQDSFSDTTWKVGADWAVTDWLRFRGTWGTSFRAPALFELFLENQTGFAGPAGRSIRASAPQRGSRRARSASASSTIVPPTASARILLAAIGPATIVSGGGIGAAQARNLDRQNRVGDPDPRSVGGAVGRAQDQPRGRLFRHQGEGRDHLARRGKHPERLL